MKYISMLVLSQVNKFVAKKDPNHTNWVKVGPWEPTAEVVVRKPFQCNDKCEDIQKTENKTCSAHEEGHCYPKGKIDRDEHQLRAETTIGDLYNTGCTSCILLL